MSLSKQTMEVARDYSLLHVLL